MDLSSINSQIATAVSATAAAAKGGAAKAAASAGPGADFVSSLDAALKSVSESQANAQELQKQFQMENPAVSLEDAVVAMSKANLSFSAAVQVRNRLVQAYDQVMNMQV